MNAGAYGGEFQGVDVHLGALLAPTAARGGRGRRTGGMVVPALHDGRGRRYVVLAATLVLRRDDPAAVQVRMDDLARRRAEKQPLELPSAGSTFKRPEGCFVGQLVQEAGLRGYRVGGAQVSEKHTGFVVNAGGATAADVRRLIADVQARVRESAGVELVPEVRLWGFEEMKEKEESRS